MRRTYRIVLPPGVVLYGGDEVPPSKAVLGDLWVPAGTSDLYRKTMLHINKWTWEQIPGGLEALKAGDV